MDQMERVLNEVHTIRDNLTVSMIFAMCVGATADATATVPRAIENQITNLRTRIERLESRDRPAA